MQHSNNPILIRLAELAEMEQRATGGKWNCDENGCKESWFDYSDAEFISALRRDARALIEIAKAAHKHAQERYRSADNIPDEIDLALTLLASAEGK